jgi:hypothetical protein
MTAKDPPLKVPELALVGSSGRNAGKTTAALALIKALGREAKVVALKVTTAGEVGAGCHRGGDGCGACSFGPGFVLEQELDSCSKKDTGRLLAAGASLSYWLRARNASLADGFKAFLEKCPKGSAIVAESNSLRRHVEPGLFIMLVNLEEPARPSAKRVLSLADLALESSGPIGFEAADLLAERVRIFRDPSGKISLSLSTASGAPSADLSLGDASA